jgi:2-polyprenyl-3-methyl-5-hydroxy-6-metoxy-1,4-benzoquinol methylase
MLVQERCKTAASGVSVDISGARISGRGISRPVGGGDRECPVCGSMDFSLMFTQEFAKIEGISFLGGYDVCSCKRCGMAYASNVPEQAAFDEYYINANKYEHDIEQPDVITGRYEYIVQEILRFASDKTAPIADIGCARSEILRSLRNLGFSDLTGIDPSVKNVEYLKSKGINGIHATINIVDTSKQYEFVTFLAVLEHIRDLRQTLSTLYAVTAANGMIIISVPDIPASGEFPYQEFSREHINYFTEVSLSNLMMKYGFYSVFFKKGHGDLVGFFKKESKSVQKDTEGEQRMRRYIDESEEYENAIYANLRQYSNKPVIVWGLGTFTQRLLVKKVLKNIVFMVDSNPVYAGKRYGDTDIIRPCELKKYAEPIILAVSPRYVDAVMFAIKNEMKLENDVIMIPPPPPTIL